MRAAVVSLALVALTIGGCVMIGGCASSRAESAAQAGYDFSSLQKVAIIEVTGAVYGQGVKNQIIDLFTMELMKKGYTVVERSQVQNLLAEQKFQASELASDEGAAKAGRILNVPAVMLISVPKYKSEKITMTAKLVGVEKGDILWIGEGSGKTGKTGATLLGAVIGAAAGAAVAGGSTSDRVLGGVIGGVAGGAAGNLLSPEQETAIKKAIAKIVSGLPSRMSQTVTPKK